MKGDRPNARKIRVAHVTFDMRIGGAEQVIRTLAEHTDPGRYEVSIVCLDQALGPFGAALRNQGFRVSSFGRRPGFDLGLVPQLHSHIVQHQIEVLHCHQYTPYVYGLLGSLGTSARVILTEHGRFHPDPRKLKRVLLNPLFSTMTDGITAISRATRKALIEIENFPARRIGVVYNGIDDTRYGLPPDRQLRQSLGIPEGSRLLGTVARMDANKNQRMMIKALNRVHASHPDTFLVIVGDGPEKELLEKLAVSLGVGSQVIFTGFREDTHRFYALMDIFLLTSFTEGTAMTLLEAMASGLPCVATDVGGNAEIVTDGETGLLVESDNDALLAEALRRLLDDESVMRLMGAAGRKRFEERFGVNRMVEAYELLYDSAVKSQPVRISV